MSGKTAKPKKKKKFRVISALIALFMVLLGLFLMNLSEYFSVYDIEQIMFNARTLKRGVAPSAVSDTLKVVLPTTMALYIIFLLVTFFPQEHAWIIYLSFLDLEVQVLPFGIFRKGYRFVAPLFLFGAMLRSLVIIDYPTYLERQSGDSDLFQQYYIDPNWLEFEFPEEKQNLIFIFLESMENSYGTSVVGGFWDKQLIPNLTNLSIENLSFSDTGRILGAGHMLFGTSWTAASMMSTTSGLPLKYPINTTETTNVTEYMPGVTALGDILEEAGYQQYLIMGSDGDYGGRKSYFQYHGNYTVFDYFTAINDKRIPSDYFENWGYEDFRLFDYAKEYLTLISTYPRPFNFTMLTADTHFPAGHACQYCEDIYSNNIENVIACSDRQVFEFISWVQEQPFGDNTTIILLGDHLFMEDKYFDALNITRDQRRIYNCIINPAVDVSLVNKTRQISNMDFFPTTLAALGVTWNDDRIALGTNLFTDTPTLIEELGLDYLNKELEMASTFYNETFLFPKD